MQKLKAKQVSADVLAGGTQRIPFVFSGGPLTTSAPAIPWVPHRNVTILGVYLVLGTISSASIMVSVLKNGVAMGNVSLSVGNTLSSQQSLNFTLTTTDKLTVNLVAVDGQDLAVNIIYI